MKKRTTYKLVMFQSVRTILNDYQSEWQGLPVFVQMVNELDSNLSLLRDQLTQQNSITQGVTAAKNQRIMALREEVVVLQRAPKAGFIIPPTPNFTDTYQNNNKTTHLYQKTVARAHQLLPRRLQYQFQKQCGLRIRSIKRIHQRQSVLSVLALSQHRGYFM